MRALLSSASASCLLATVLLASGSAQAPAPDATARATERVKALQREAEALAGQERSLLGDLRKLEVERDLRLEEARRLDADAADLAKQVSDTQTRIAATEQELAAARPVLEARMVDVYKLGRPGYARVLLGTSDLRHVGRSLRMVSALAEQDRRRFAQFTATRERLVSSQAALTREAAQLATLQQQARQSAAKAQQAAAARAALVRQIDERRDLNAQMVAELEHAKERMTKALEGLPGSGPVDDSLPLRPFKGTIDWPLSGRLLSRFGQHRSAAYGTTTTQSGVEIECSAGSPARAVHEGRVAFADVFAGFGQLVIVEHGNLAYSLYGYLDHIDVAKNARVTVGQPIGSCGRSPSGTPAVYFELRIDARPVDPVQWLKPR